MNFTLIFGLSANPFHQGHLHLVVNAAWALIAREYQIGKIILIPVYYRKLVYNEIPKDELPSNFEHRFRLCKLGAKEIARRLEVPDSFVEVSRIEEKLAKSRKAPNSTAETLSELRREEITSTDLIFLIGSDHVSGERPKFGGWNQPETILRLAAIAIYPRPGHPPNETFLQYLVKKGAQFIRLDEMPTHEIASRKIRARLKAGEDPLVLARDGLLSKSVALYLASPEAALPEALRHLAVLALLKLSLLEDLSTADMEQFGPQLLAGDITSTATLGPDAHLDGQIKAKAPGVIAGLPVVAAVFKMLDPHLVIRSHTPDGERVQPDQVLAKVSGAGIPLLAGERAALNFLGRLSGVATLTRQFVDTVAGTGAVILDTRKTNPGARRLEKYAVRKGGGQNHRIGLYDMVLIKDNHIDAAGGVRAAVERVHNRYRGRFPVEIEVKTLAELDVALKLPVDRIMLDNMSLETMRKAVAITNGRVPLEASGNVALATVRTIAETGVDYISVGSLTHSAPVLDFSMSLV